MKVTITADTHISLQEVYYLIRDLKLFNNITVKVNEE